MENVSRGAFSSMYLDTFDIEFRLCSAANTEAALASYIRILW